MGGGHLTPQCVIHTSVQTGCGRADEVPLGLVVRHLSAILSSAALQEQKLMVPGTSIHRMSASYTTTFITHSEMRLSVRAYKVSNQSGGASVGPLSGQWEIVGLECNHEKKHTGGLKGNVVVNGARTNVTVLLFESMHLCSRNISVAEIQGVFFHFSYL